ncbi:MAG: TerC family protein [Rhizobiales bacterium]|jgi:YjbE family integral membrane protein|nr:TerC family protein [Hyphomicrobiales bacterium]
MYSELTALFSVLVIDLVLAGDNAVVVGLAAAGLPHDQRRKAVLIGIGAAAVLRICFAIFATKLLAIIGLTLAGGILLLWVAWKLAREILVERRARNAPHPAHEDATAPKTLGRAVVQIVVADVSMSLDNVLAVAGAAREHLTVLIIGLSLSVILMGIAASLIADLLKRYFWIAYFGLAIIAWVAVGMIWDGAEEVITGQHEPPAQMTH